MLDYATLRFVWWLLIGALLIGFAITDGFDMGVGILLTLIGKNDAQRRVMIGSILPHWDGNQVWLLLAGGAMFAAWPTVYATAFSSFYIAMILVLVALYLRPFSFEYRQKISHHLWRKGLDGAITFGSTVPALIFGVAFGNLLQGIPCSFDRFATLHYHGTFFALLNPFALLCGVVSLSMLTMHGGAWLQLRTTKDLYHKSQNATQLAAVILILSFSIAGIWLHRWIDGYQVLSSLNHLAESNHLRKLAVRLPGGWGHNFARYPWLALIPFLALLFPLGTLLSSRGGRDKLTFLFSSCSLAATITTAGVTMFPFIIPSSTEPSHSLTIWDATSSQKTLSLMLYIVLLLLPMVLGYTIWCYIKMSGRLDEEQMDGHNEPLY